MPASHWSRSKPVFEMVEAAFAEAVFIGPNSRRTATLPGGSVAIRRPGVGDDRRRMSGTQLHRGLRCEFFYDVYGSC
jgi:hypothetical protein